MVSVSFLFACFLQCCACNESQVLQSSASPLCYLLKTNGILDVPIVRNKVHYLSKNIYEPSDVSFVLVCFFSGKGIEVVKAQI